MKEFIGVLAVVLTFVGYIPYIKDTIAVRKNLISTVVLLGHLSLLSYLDFKSLEKVELVHIQP
jgi:hypothetical protein